MLYYIVLLVIIALFCYADHFQKKTDYQSAKQLNKQFEDWVQSDGTTIKPNNATFSELYQKRYKSETHPQNIVQQKGYVVSTNKIDVVASFPSLNNAILGTQLRLLDNLEDYYTREYEKTKSAGYIIQLIISLPLKLLKYIGLDDQKTTSKLLHVLIWILGLFLPPLKDLVIRFIDFLLTNQ